MESSGKRLSKALAAAGIASRRACETIIESGRVTVNGEKVTVPQTQVDWDRDKIAVDGKVIRGEENKICYVLNKPLGYLCTNKRVGNQKLVVDLIPDDEKRLFTVGRLDKETEGLILVTNDGHLANKIIHPSSNITKEYLAKTDHEITPVHLKEISEGVEIEGVHVKPTRVQKVRKGTVKVTVKEGKKHEVRLLLQSAGLDVLHLKRIRIGSLQLGNLQPGEYRVLTESECKQLVKE